ncbi:hypothetical protein Tco_1508813 [Tanacetum coccineum]
MMDDPKTKMEVEVPYELLKDRDYSSKNHVRRFLRTLLLKWIAKVMTIEEANDLATLPLDELFGNLKEVKAQDKSEVATIATKKVISLVSVQSPKKTRLLSKELRAIVKMAMNYIIDLQKENEELLKFSKDFSKTYEKLLQEKHLLGKEHSKLFSKVNELKLELKKLAISKETYDGEHVVFGSNLKGKVIGGEDDRINEPLIQDPVSSPSLESNASESDYPKSVIEARGHPIEQTYVKSMKARQPCCSNEMKEQRARANGGEDKLLNLGKEEV